MLGGYRLGAGFPLFVRSPASATCKDGGGSGSGGVPREAGARIGLRWAAWPGPGGGRCAVPRRQGLDVGLGAAGRHPGLSGRGDGGRLPVRGRPGRHRAGLPRRGAASRGWRRACEDYFSMSPGRGSPGSSLSAGAGNGRAPGSPAGPPMSWRASGLCAGSTGMSSPWASLRFPGSGSTVPRARSGAAPPAARGCAWPRWSTGGGSTAGDRRPLPGRSARLRLRVRQVVVVGPASSRSACWRGGGLLRVLTTVP